MQRRFLLLLTFLLAFSLVPVSASAAVESIKFKGGTASADFFTAPDDPCISASGFVQATEGRIKEGGGKPETVSEVFVFVFGFNNCTGEFIDAFGSAPLTAEAFVVDKQLNSATLNTTVEVFDFVTGSNYPVSINLTWTGIGEVSKQKSKFSFDDGTCKFRSDSKGSFRNATATGSVTVEETSFAFESFGFAQLADVQQGQAAINCE